MQTRCRRGRFTHCPAAVANKFAKTVFIEGLLTGHDKQRCILGPFCNVGVRRLPQQLADQQLCRTGVAGANPCNDGGAGEVVVRWNVGLSRFWIVLKEHLVYRQQQFFYAEHGQPVVGNNPGAFGLCRFYARLKLLRLYFNNLHRTTSRI
ncbi:hypothetical protein SDC9_78806 [bioreactor metagenome]|uniref:Uncharacterized protein n=1 Tax=bioreactor metagenome TaxID=1076179 RepID=A0A644Z249_9ZZZZ